MSDSNFTSALDLVAEPRFRNLRSVIQDAADNASVKYPIGFGDCFMSTEQFYELYKDQTSRKEVYTVKLPVSKISYKQGSVRQVRPEYCIENFELFSNTIDFCESEIPVVFYDEATGSFYLVKKQHTTAQVAALSLVKNEEIDIMTRVVSFNSSVTVSERSLEASKLFYKEIKGINTTKDWEALPHQVACGDELATKTMDFYKSIPGFTWQPVDFDFPLVSNPHFCCTKVAQMKKLVSYAINDGELDTLRDIVQALCNSVDWDKEKPNKELSAYLLRGFYNFEKRLHPLLDDAMGGIGYNFDIIKHIEDYFASYVLKRYLGSTSTDKKPWQHLIKTANHVNDYLIRTGQSEDSFFTYKRSEFVDAVFALANPTSKVGVERSEIVNYIKAYCQ